MNTLKILVAEDDRLNRLMISKLLEKYGVDCDTAEDGRVALEKCFAGKYDIVILDHNMPGYSGAECAVRIRQKYNNDSGRPLIVGVSADDEHEENEAFDMFMAKPFKIEKIQELLTAVSKE